MQRFHLSKEAARSLSNVTGQRRTIRPGLTELEVLEDLIDQAQKELDALYQQSAESALEGEAEYLDKVREAG